MKLEVGKKYICRHEGVEYIEIFGEERDYFEGCIRYKDKGNDDYIYYYRNATPRRIQTRRSFNKNPFWLYSIIGEFEESLQKHICEFIDPGFGKELWCKYEDCKNTKTF